MEEPIQIVESEMLSEKNRKIIILNGFKFSFHKNLVGENQRWKCTQHGCKAVFKRNKECEMFSE